MKRAKEGYAWHTKEKVAIADAYPTLLSFWLWGMLRGAKVS